MATAREHADLYDQLRGQLLTRHFAYGRFFRRNLMSTQTFLGYVQGNPRPGGAPPDADDAACDCVRRAWVVPSAYIAPEDQLTAAFMALPASTRQLELWRVVSHEGENPLAYGSKLLLALSIEHALGCTDALPILRLALHAIGSNYKFTGNDFDGYIIRWDAVQSDKWETRDVGGSARPVRCCEFLLDDQHKSLYCTPFDHPDYVKFDSRSNNDASPGRYDALDRYRRWEPSMDEMIGLVGSYDVMYALVDDADFRQEIARQVNNLARYFAAHAYFLVRPLGGLTARGSGLLPALEFPFGQVFERITGQRYETKIGFEDAMAKAGVWGGMKPTVDRWTVAGMLLGAVALSALAMSVASLTFFGLVSFVGVLAAMAGAAIGYVGGRGFGVYVASLELDMWNEGFRGELAGGWGLRQLGPRMRFVQWMRNTWRSSGAAIFPQHLAITALQDTTDTTVGTEFLSSLKDSESRHAAGTLGNTGYAVALAAALGETSRDKELMAWLDEAYDDLNPQSDRFVLRTEARRNGEPPVVVERLDRVPGREAEKPMSGLEYMACLALSWLRVKRQTDASETVSPELFGLPAGITRWTPPAVPMPVITAGLLSEWQRPEGRGSGDQGVTAFPTTDIPIPSPLHQKSAEPPVTEVPTTIETVTVKVPESSPLVITGVIVGTNDGVRIETTGRIWAGVWLTGDNDANGWTTIEWGNTFPLPGTNPFCLLYKIVEVGRQESSVSWRRAGSNTSFTWSGPIGALYLRTNDDKPGNGSGEFTSTIRLTRY